MISCSLVIALGAPLWSGCEEEVVEAPRRGSRRAVRAQARGGIDLSRYNRPGKGPKDAPDWIQSQDFSLMRRYSQDTLKGFRNGNEFTPADVIFERREGGWFLILNEVALTFPTQLAFAGERIEIPLTSEPSGQLREQKGKGESRAAWRLPRSQTVGQTRKWDAESLYSVELLEWKATPYKPAGDVFQVVGTATGRLMAHFSDSAGVQGWVVGRFENARIRYMGNPNKW